MGDASSITRDYYYYQRWTYQFPIGLLAGILTVGVLTLLLTATIRKLVMKCSGRSKTDVPWQVKFLLDGARDAMLRITNFLLFEFEYQKNSEAYFLYGVRVYRFVLQYLFIVLLTLLSVCILSFWNTFLAEATVDQCDHIQDCFLIHRANQTPIETNPIINCNNHPINEEVSILCFELVYRYSEGLGEAGGFLFSMQVITNILIYIVVRMVRTIIKATKILRTVNAIKNGVPPGNRKINRHVGAVSLCSKAWAVVVVLTAYVAVAVLLPVWLFHDRQEFLETLKTPQRQFQLFLYEYTIFVLFLVPPIVGGGIYGSKMFETIDIEAYSLRASQHVNSADRVNTKANEEQTIGTYPSVDSNHNSSIEPLRESV